MKITAMISRTDADDLYMKFYTETEKFVHALAEKFAPLALNLTQEEFAEQWQECVGAEFKRMDLVMRNEVERLCSASKIEEKNNANI